MIYHVRMSLEQSVLIALHTHQAVLLKSRGRWHDVAGWHQLHHRQQQPLLVSKLSRVRGLVGRRRHGKGS